MTALQLVIFDALLSDTLRHRTIVYSGTLTMSIGAECVYFYIKVGKTPLQDVLAVLTAKT